MEALFTAFRNPATLAVLQTVLEAAAVLLLVLLLLRRPGAPRPGAHNAAEALRAVAEETGRVAARCEENLRERTELLKGLLSRLDERLEEAGRTLRALDAARAPEKPRPPARPRAPEGAAPEDILALAKRGLDPRSIAAALGKPLGEVELVMDLQRLAPGG